MTADDIIAAARECIGTPFAHQGRVVGVGLDCAGVAVHAVRALGVDVLDFAGYGRTPNKGHLAAAMDAQPMLERVPNIVARSAGDILLMRFLGEPQHVGICTGGGIIHAYEAVGTCCEHDICAKWAARIVRVYRVKGLS
jgi:cell wall-associated NlpC family hydrolase